ncbi:hypothetical protein KP509_21G042400 [Ceratopteris richardii]|nr:hypothetical protein KP509_21G042400 [Ceratopteris richardii]
MIHNGNIQIQGEESLRENEARSYVQALRSCAKTRDLQRGIRVHDVILKYGMIEKCSDALISMYAKCGAFEKSKALLETHKSKDVFTWNSLILEYVRRDRCHDALQLFELIKSEGLNPNAVTLSCMLKACGNIGALSKGKEIHDEVSKQRLLEKSVIIGNSLVDMYARCGALAKAQEVLEELPVRNVISWSTLIAGYTQHGKGEQALNCFKLMKLEGLTPNAVTFCSILKACSSLGTADIGKEVHKLIAEQGLLGNNVVLGTAIVDMYAKCGELAKAHHVLADLPSRNVICWSALIAGYAKHNKNEHALHCFDRMKQEGFFPDAVTFIYILKVCGNIRAVDKGDEIYYDILKQRLLQNNISLGTALVDMYAKCGDLAKAQQVLESLPLQSAISWSALIAGYAEQGECDQALNAFEEMQRAGFQPDAITFTCLLKGCGNTGAVEKGEKIHNEISKYDFLKNDAVLGTALVDMYAKCGALAKAREVLEELPKSNTMTWNALIAGYIQHDEVEEALKCYEEIQHKGVAFDVVTYLYILKACGSLGAVKNGERLHNEIVKQGRLGHDLVLRTALLDMYGKCGALQKAWCVLQEFPVQDVISWNALITGSVRTGEGGQALSYYEKLTQEGISPNAATLSSVLTACSRAGLLNSAHVYLQNMNNKYGIEPDLEHYACMVDLFGRAGYLNKALKVVEKMPFCISGVWYSLLSACGKCGDVNVGKWAFEQAILMNKNNAAPYALMANVYTAAGMQDNAKKVKTMRIK